MGVIERTRWGASLGCACVCVSVCHLSVGSWRIKAEFTKKGSPQL